MHSFEELSAAFAARFNNRHFPQQPSSLYDPADYFLGLGGKRVRPVLCLMGNELFGAIEEDTWEMAIALELFHNFTLIHDDIMDKAPLRRGKATVHARYNDTTALLAGDVMLLRCYEILNDTEPVNVQALFRILSKAGREICEGQQMDMEYEKAVSISLAQYLQM